MPYSHSFRGVAAAVVLAGLLSAGALAPAFAASPPAKDRAAAAIDPAAVAAFTRMGQYLATLERFELIADTTVEAVLRGGHQVEIGGTVRYFVQRPDRVRVDSQTDTLKRQYFLDGKTFTMVAPEDGYFGTAPARSGIRAQLAYAAQVLNVELPLADLFEWVDPATALKPFRRGFYVGAARIDGVVTDHYALIGRNVDLEVWIQRGESPLPLKLAVVDRAVQGNPRFSARLKWLTSPTFGDDVFTFTPGKDMDRIEMLTPKPAAKGDK